MKRLGFWWQGSRICPFSQLITTLDTCGYTEWTSAATVKIDADLTELFWEIKVKYDFTYSLYPLISAFSGFFPFPKERLKREGSSLANLKAMPQVRWCFLSFWSKLFSGDINICFPILKFPGCWQLLPWASGLSIKCEECV